MRWNYNKLKGRIKEMCGTQDEFATRLGIGRVSLSQRLNNQLEFTQDEMFRACDVLEIDKVDIPIYFFVPEV